LRLQRENFGFLTQRRKERGATIFVSRICLLGYNPFIPIFRLSFWTAREVRDP
jgi:hypothetical protein